MTPLREQLTGVRLQRTTSGLFLGGVLLGVYLGVVGFTDVQRALWSVPPRRVLSLLIVGAVPLFFWGAGLRLVFGTLGYSLRLWNAVLLFSASSFLNAITPFGQAGGDPLTAVLFTRAVGADFETSLAAIGSLNALNRVAAVVLGLFSVGYLGSSVGTGGSVADAALFVAGLSVGTMVGLALGWQYRYRLVALLAAGLTPLLRRGVRLIPRASPPTRDAIERRGARFVDALDRLASDPRRLAGVFALSIAGQLVVATALWVALAALGFHPSLAVVLLLLPLAKLGGLAPTPGGFGSTTALLGTLLVSTTGVVESTAGAAVLLYRATAFWIPSVLGGLVTGWVWVVRPRRTDTRSRPSPGVAEETSRSERDELTASVDRPAVPRLLFAFAAVLAVLAALTLHQTRLVVEPDDVAVHLIRDTSLVVSSFVLTWALLGRLPPGWLE